MERLVLWQRLVSGAREEDRDPKVEVAWVRRVVARLAAEGGELITVVGGSVVATFDALDVKTAIDLSLALVEESERDDDPASAVRITVGIATGEVRAEESAIAKQTFHVGPTFDRAQLLANRARVGEIVVDASTRESCGGLFLFQRLVGSGESTIRGHSIDRTCPRLETCRASLGKLAKLRLPQGLASAKHALESAAKREGAQLLVLRGPTGIGARQLVEHVAETLLPSLVLRIPPAPGGHEPLGSLRAALTNAFVGVTGVDKVASTLDVASNAALCAIARGDVIELPAAIDAVAVLLHTVRAGRPKAMIVLDPVTGPDTSTLQLIGELVARPGVEVLVVGRARGESKVPAALAAGRSFTEINIAPLKPEEARKLAEDLFVRVADPELSRRVVALSGDSPIAVLETVRWLVSIGDVVHTPRGFRFRLAPRVATKVMPLDAIYAERIATLDPDAQRLLEIIAMIPCGFGNRMLDAVARADGLDAKGIADATGALLALALPVDAETVVASEALRDAVFRSMPPARSGELARYIANELSKRPRTGEGFMSATLAYYMAEGGQPLDAAELFLDAASRAAARQHARAAIRLAATAVELDPSAKIRDASSKLLRSVVSARTKRPSVPAGPTELATMPPPTREPDSFGKLATNALGALRARDYEGVERYIDTAVAQGGSLVAAERLRALAHLARGDRRAATLSLGRARGFAADDNAERARNGLLDAWLQITQGAAREGLRSALLALAGARTASDALGERAGLRTVAVCLELLGRGDDASALREGLG